MKRALPGAMKNLSVTTVAVALSAVMAASIADGQEAGRGRRHTTRAKAARSQHAATTPMCGDALGFQVLLDRHGFSSGEIDGKFGANTKRALAAFQEASNLKTSSALDCETWAAL